MGILTLPKRFNPDFSTPNKKPIGGIEIDTSSSLSKGLVLDVEMTEGAGAPIDLVTGRQLTSNGQGWDIAHDGMGKETTYASDSSVNITGLEALSGTSHTIHIRARISAFDTSGMVICGWNNNGSHFWQVDDTLTSVFIGGTSTPGGTHDGDNNNYHDWWFFSDGSGAAIGRGFYEDGVLLNTGGSAVTLPTGSKDFQLGKFSGSDNFSLNGGIVFCRIWNRTLKNTERLTLLRDNYAHLRPVTPQVYFKTSEVGAQDISPTGIASAEAFGTAVITTGAVDITPTGIASAEAFGTASLGLDVTPSGIASEEAFGTAVLTTGAVDLTPSGIASEEAFGTAVVTQGFVLLPTGIPSTEAFGTAVITTGAVTVSPTGIASAEAFGSHTVTLAGDKDIKIDFANEKVLNTNLQSTTLYFNGTDYFTID